MKERPRGNVVERAPTQERERLNTINPVSARMLLGSIKPYYLDAKARSVSAEDKVKAGNAKRDSLKSIFAAIGAASIESRSKSSKPLSNREWNESMQNFVHEMVDESVPDELRGERLRALSALDIKPKQTKKNDQGLQVDIENFRKNYVDYGKAADIDRFVADISHDLRDENGVVSINALEKRLTAIEPILGVFGEDTNVADLITNVARVDSMVSQPEQIRQRVVSAAADTLSTAAVGEEQQSLNLLSRHAAEARPHPILQKAVLIDLRDILEKKKKEKEKYILTPELARSDPEKFVQAIYQKLENDYPLAYKAWQSVSQAGRALPENVIIEPDGVDAKNMPDGTIHIGASNEMYKPLPFEHEHMNYEKEIMYRFVHELSHDFTNVLRQIPEVLELEKNFGDIRKNEFVGVTTIANRDYYRDQGPEYQGKEDMVELVNKFLQDPFYLQRYLIFLSDPNQSQNRAAMHVITLTPEDANQIYQIVAGATKAVIQTEFPQKGGALSEHITESSQEQPVYQAA